MASVSITSNDSPFSFQVSPSGPTEYRATLAYFNAILENAVDNVFVFRSDGVGNLTFHAIDGDTTDLSVTIENLDTETSDTFYGSGLDLVVPFVACALGYNVTINNASGFTKGYIVEIESTEGSDLYDIGIHVFIPAGTLDPAWFEAPDFIEGEIRLYLNSAQEGAAFVYADDSGSSSGVLFTTAGISPANIAVSVITEPDSTVSDPAYIKAVRDGVNAAVGQLGIN